MISLIWVIADDLFETVSKQLLEKAKNMLNKYRYLLLKEAKVSSVFSYYHDGGTLSFMYYKL